MARMTLVKYFLRLSIFLFSLLLLISLTMGTVYADSGSDGDKINKAAYRVTRHMEKMRQKTKMQGPRTDLGVRQITDVEVSLI